MKDQNRKAMWAKILKQPQTTNMKVFAKLKTGIPYIAEAEFGVEYEIRQQDLIKSKKERT